MPAWFSRAVHALFAGPEGTLTLCVVCAGLGLVVGGMWLGRLRVQRAAARPKRDPWGDTPQSSGAPTGARQRKVERQSGVWTRVSVMDLQEGGPLFEARVVDYDSNGVGLMTFKEVPVGHVLSLRPSRAPANCGWIRAEIRSCHQVEKSIWRVGCHVADHALASLIRQYG